MTQECYCYEPNTFLLMPVCFNLNDNEVSLGKSIAPHSELEDRAPGMLRIWRLLLDFATNSHSCTLAKQREEGGREEEAKRLRGMTLR